MAGNADLLNREFERGLMTRVAAAVKEDPAMRSRYRSIRIGRLVDRLLWFLAALFFLPLVWGVWIMTRAHGELSPVILMAANIVGTFLPLSVLGILWRILTGAAAMAALPRMPVSDNQNFARAWRGHSVWAWRSAFLLWLAVNAELVWYGKLWAQAWFWVPFFAAIQACLSLAVCSVVSLVNHRLKEQSIQMHVLWLKVALVAVIAVSMEDEAMFRFRPLVDQVNWWLPAHFGVDGLVAAANGIPPHPALFAGLVLGSFIVHWICGRIHRRFHPLARLSQRGDASMTVIEQPDATVDGWCLSDEHGAFWSRRGPVEKALWGLTNRRERLALEGIANARLNLTVHWTGTLALVFAFMLVAWALRLSNSIWSTLPIVCAAIAAVAFVVAPPVVSRQRFGGNMTVMQNPFPFLPVSAKDLYFAMIKATIVKAGFSLTHVLCFLAYILATRGDFRGGLGGFQFDLVIIIWIVATFIGAFAAISPILVQSNVISIKRVNGWIALAAYLFAAGGPIAFFIVLVHGGSSGWLLALAPVVMVCGSAYLTIWMWREGSYDFTGIPLISKGVEQLGPSNYSTGKSID